MRFDELELEPAVAIESAAATEGVERAPWIRRIMALLTDLSLFAALVLALSPLLPPNDRLAMASLAGFVLVVSYYYFVGSWLLWGKTIGGAIFDVRVVSDAMTPKAATMRWLGMFASMLTAGIGFLFAALPSRLSLADRLSSTRCIAG